MKRIFLRLALAAAVTLAACVFASMSDAQQADEDRAPASQHQPQAQTTPKPSTQDTAKPPGENHSAAEANDEQTQDALAFTGMVEEDKGALILSDHVSKVSYSLDDPLKARPYLGRQVKIVGKLAMRSNTIQIESIEPVQ